MERHARGGGSSRATAAFIPQDPLTAFNPVRRVEGADHRPARPPSSASVAQRPRGRARWSSSPKCISPIRSACSRSYPHQLSGGMRQRVLIAAAFAAEPKLIVADEPTTALDVTVQKQILRLIAEMQARHGTALLFVTHDLGVVAKICQKVTVLFGGSVVEDTRRGEPLRRAAPPLHRRAPRRDAALRPAGRVAAAGAGGASSRRRAARSRRADAAWAAMRRR